MEAESSLPGLQEPSDGPYAELEKPSQYHPFILL
jgi:hypothetical protein